MIPAAVFAAIVAVSMAVGGNDDVLRVPHPVVHHSDALANSDGTARHWRSPARFSVAVQGLAADGTAEPYAPEPVADLTPEPPPVKEDAPVVSPEPADAPEGFWGEVTHYGESFNGLVMGCEGAGRYYSWDVGIAAAPWPVRDSEWPCGTRFLVTGPVGSVAVVRTDSCPGCHKNQLDLSEAGMLAVCGYLGRCPVWIEVR